MGEVIVGSLESSQGKNELTDPEIILEYIESMLKNQQVSESKVCQSAEFREIQEELQKLAHDQKEVYDFLDKLADGKLGTTLPKQDNVLAFPLKQLHSNLLHLTWQAKQVAKGDYNQQIDFLGDFSDAFNRMTNQLSVREQQLKGKAEDLMQSMYLLLNIVDGIKDWVIVVDKERERITYMNESAMRNLVDEGASYSESTKHPLLHHLLECRRTVKYAQVRYKYKRKENLASVDSYEMKWKGRDSFVYIVTDITEGKAYEKYLENIAYNDELTGVYNRRYCHKAVECFLNEKKSFSLCFIDIDHLKDVNDQYGHSEGDRYIKNIIEKVYEGIRKTDILCRQGGDEFIVLMPETSKEAAESCMEYTCNRLSQRKDKYELSISYGVVFVEGECALSYQEIIEEADQKMYDRKVSNHQQRL